MSTLDATVSMLEVMSEEARIQVYQFTRQLFTSRKPANPFTPVGTDQVLTELAESRQQFAEGRGMDMKDALNKLGEEHGFVD